MSTIPETSATPTAGVPAGYPSHVTFSNVPAATIPAGIPSAPKSRVSVKRIGVETYLRVASAFSAVARIVQSLST